MRCIRRTLVAALAIIALLTPVAGQVDPATLGPRVGSQVPDFSAVDQFGRTQTLSSIVQRDGAMLVFFRSADW